MYYRTLRRASQAHPTSIRPIVPFLSHSSTQPLSTSAPSPPHTYPKKKRRWKRIHLLFFLKKKNHSVTFLYVFHGIKNCYYDLFQSSISCPTVNQEDILGLDSSPNEEQTFYFKQNNQLPQMNSSLTTDFLF